MYFGAACEARSRRQHVHKLWYRPAAHQQHAEDGCNQAGQVKGPLAAYDVNEDSPSECANTVSHRQMSHAARSDYYDRLTLDQHSRMRKLWQCLCRQFPFLGCRIALSALANCSVLFGHTRWQTQQDRRLSPMQDQGSSQSLSRTRCTTLLSNGRVSD